MLGSDRAGNYCQRPNAVTGETSLPAIWIVIQPPKCSADPPEKRLNEDFHKTIGVMVTHDPHAASYAHVTRHPRKKGCCCRRDRFELPGGRPRQFRCGIGHPLPGSATVVKRNGLGLSVRH